MIIITLVTRWHLGFRRWVWRNLRATGCGDLNTVKSRGYLNCLLWLKQSNNSQHLFLCQTTTVSIQSANSFLWIVYKFSPQYSTSSKAGRWRIFGLVGATSYGNYEYCFLSGMAMMLVLEIMLPVAIMLILVIMLMLVTLSLKYGRKVNVRTLECNYIFLARYPYFRYAFFAGGWEMVSYLKESVACTYMDCSHII